jgi:XTP/dITP diphosphohydrolase
MNKKLVFATNNTHKFREISAITGKHITLLSLADIGCSEEIPEEQETIEGNARQKALFIYNKYGMDCFADDTGLEIDALNGEPGVYSARYAGPGCNFEDNMDLVLTKMKDVKNRKARFKTIIALVADGKVNTFEGIIEGSITTGKRGTGGFGYDAVFLPDGYNKTFAEMIPEEKNKISHRAKAVKAFTDYLLNYR